MPMAWLLGVGAGLASGLLHLGGGLGTGGSLLLSQIAALPIFLVALGLGFGPAVLAAAGGALLVVLFGGGLAPLSYILLNGVLAVGLGRLALLSRAGESGREWYPAGHLLTWLFALVAGIYGLALLAAALSGQGLLSRLTAMLEQAIAAFGASLPAQQADLLRAAVALVPGIMGAFVMLQTMLNGLLAQFLLLRGGRAVRPAESFAGLALPRELAYVLAASLAAALLPTGLASVGLTLAILAAVPYFLLGLAVVHAWLARHAARGLLLTLVYGALVVVLALFLPAAALLVALGLAEQFVGLRARWARGKEE
ncbi:MAG: DUF2232 domain-containing protein [Alphaproteobacteria bacterium]|nr:DUF2232 domain-containing protein [Alphaproteobacteria bacterium]